MIAHKKPKLKYKRIEKVNNQKQHQMKWMPYKKTKTWISKPKYCWANVFNVVVKTIYGQQRPRQISDNRHKIQIECVTKIRVENKT